MCTQCLLAEQKAIIIVNVKHSIPGKGLKAVLLKVVDTIGTIDKVYCEIAVVFNFICHL